MKKKQMKMNEEKDPWEDITEIKIELSDEDIDIDSLFDGMNVLDTFTVETEV